MFLPYGSILFLKFGMTRIAMPPSCFSVCPNLTQPTAASLTALCSRVVNSFYRAFSIPPGRQIHVDTSTQQRTNSPFLIPLFSHKWTFTAEKRIGNSITFNLYFHISSLSVYPQSPKDYSNPQHCPGDKRCNPFCKPKPDNTHYQFLRASIAPFIASASTSCISR